MTTVLIAIGAFIGGFILGCLITNIWKSTPIDWEDEESYMN